MTRRAQHAAPWVPLAAGLNNSADSCPSAPRFRAAHARGSGTHCGCDQVHSRSRFCSPLVALRASRPQTRRQASSSVRPPSPRGARVGTAETAPQESLPVDRFIYIDHATTVASRCVQGECPAGPDDQLDAAERPDGRRWPEGRVRRRLRDLGSRWHGRRRLVVRRERAALHPRGRDDRHDLGRRPGLAPLPRGSRSSWPRSNAGSARPSPSISARATHSSSRPRSGS
jgi:hypothetical protein